METFNLGTGVPYSVTEMVDAFERVSGVKVNHKYGERRAGDLPKAYASADKAWRVLGWKAEKGLAICAEIPGIGKRKKLRGIRDK